MMSTAAITMMVLGCSIVWGGLLVCLTIALKNSEGLENNAA